MPVLESTPGPLRWKLWTFEWSRTKIVYVPGSRVPADEPPSVSEIEKPSWAPTSATSVRSPAGARFTSKVAFTCWAGSSLTVHEPAPEQAPPQPEKVESSAAFAASVTLVPPSKLAEQCVPQSMPAGLLDTVPLPPPPSSTDRVNLAGPKPAVPFLAAVIATVQGPGPAQSPPQPA